MIHNILGHSCMLDTSTMDLHHAALYIWRDAHSQDNDDDVYAYN